ncbi:MAG: TetR/AcrR family transcriptional regulator [Ilumatobacteraceae bacterium]
MPKVVDVEQRRAELASAVARVIARSGIEGASMRQVAAEAGWTTGTLVHYFADKRELLQFTLCESLDRRRAQRFDRAGLGPREAIRHTLVNALPITEESRLHWIVTIAFTAQAHSDVALSSTQRDAYREFRSYLAELLLDDGAASTHDDAVVEAERLIALVDGVALQALFDPDSWPPERQLQALDVGLGVTV